MKAEQFSNKKYLQNNYPEGQLKAQHLKILW